MSVLSRPSPRPSSTSSGRVRATDITHAYRFFLGRPPETQAAADEKEGLDRDTLVRVLLSSSEFEQQFVAPVVERRPFEAQEFAVAPDPALLGWAAEVLPMAPETGRSLAQAGSWYDAYALLLADTDCRALMLGAAPALESRGLTSGLEALRYAQHRCVVGDLDEVLRDRVTGWAVNEGTPSERVTVELLLDGRPAGVAVTGHFRRDLQEKHGGDGLYGFEMRLPSLADGGLQSSRRLELRDAATGVGFGRSRVVASRARQASEIEELRDEVRRLGEVLSRVEGKLDRASRALGFPLELYDDYRRAFYRRTPAAIEAERESAAQFVHPPRLVVVAPLEDDVQRLEALARSLAEQSYDRFVLASGAATPSQAVLSSAQVSTDDLGRLLAEAEFALLLAPGETLSADALHSFVEVLQAAPDLRVLYADEDHLIQSGASQRREPLLRGSFDPESLLQENALSGLLAVKSDILARVLAEGASLAASRRHDLVLRLLEGAAPRQVRHVPRILGHVPDRLDQNPDPSAVESHLARTGAVGEVTAVDNPSGESAPSALRVKWALPRGAKAAVVIPTRDRLDLIGPCLVSILARSEANATPLEIVVVDNGGRAEQTRAFLKALNVSSQTTLLSWDHPFNWAAINNYAADQVEADVLIFLNDDTVVLTPDWSDELCRQALRPGVGAVGARLLYEDGGIQHAGIVFGGVQDSIAHEGVGLPGDDPGYLSRHARVRRVSAVTGACLATSSSAFRRVGGFDAETFPRDGNDVDYCLKLERAGLDTLYDPYCTLYHFESKSRGYTSTDPARAADAERALAALRARWGDRLDHDPYYNPHFDRLARPFEQLGPPPHI